jgi:excisionase family DNA binding protein
MYPMNMSYSQDTFSLFTVEEVALALKIKPATVRGWAREGRENGVPVVRIGRLLRFDPAALRDWILQGGAKSRGLRPNEVGKRRPRDP